MAPRRPSFRPTYGPPFKLDWTRIRARTPGTKSAPTCYVGWYSAGSAAGRCRQAPEKNCRTYRCSSRETPSGPCGGKRVNADDVEGFIWERVAEVLRDPTVILDARNRARELGPNQTLQTDLEVAERALAKVQTRQRRLVRLYSESEDIGVEAIKERMVKVEQERQRLEASIVNLHHRMAQQEKDDDSWEALSAYCDEVADQIDSFTFEDKRQALERLRLTLRASGRRWSIRFVLPGWECEPFEVEVGGA